jgi:hypothetical protein
MPIRPLGELVYVDRPAWAGISALIESAGERVEVLPVERRDGEDTLYRLQVTAGSALGALAVHCGGLLVEHGWLRVLGGGARGLPSLADANHLGSPSERSEPPGLLDVARDVLGGRFAVNGGALTGTLGDTFYFAPDTLAWESLGMGHGAFVTWSLSAGVGDFYRDLRWPGWEEAVAAVPLEDALSVYPPLFSAESGTGEPRRESVPWEEVAQLNVEMAAQLADVPDGARFETRPND